MELLAGPLLYSNCLINVRCDHYYLSIYKVNMALHQIIIIKLVASYCFYSEMLLSSKSTII